MGLARRYIGSRRLEGYKERRGHETKGKTYSSHASSDPSCQFPPHPRKDEVDSSGSTRTQEGQRKVVSSQLKGVS